MSCHLKNRRFLSHRQCDRVARTLLEWKIIHFDEAHYRTQSDLVHVAVDKDSCNHVDIQNGRYVNVWHQPDFSDCVLYQK